VAAEFRALVGHPLDRRAPTLVKAVRDLRGRVDGAAHRGGAWSCGSCGQIRRVAQLGYAAFGFTLGVAGGLLIRRAVPAMALTLAVFAAVQVVMPLWIRPHLLPADQTTAAIASTHATFSDFSGTSVLTANVVPGQPGAWILSSGPVNAAGRPASPLPGACAQTAEIPTVGSGGTTASPSDVQRCLAGHGIREAVRYQPASHYWPLQLTETAIFLVLALGLAGFCFWWLDRRHA
jgi:hypothetical protein